MSSQASRQAGGVDKYLMGSEPRGGLQHSFEKRRCQEIQNNCVIEARGGDERH